MIENTLKSDLDIFLSNISATQSIHYQLKTYLTNHKKNYLPTLQTGFMGTALIMGDLTGETDNGWKLNYPTEFNNSIELSEMPNNIDELISREGMRNLATAYEILESFLFNLTASFLKLNPELLKSAKKIKAPIKDSLYKKIRLYRERNNKELFKLIRSLSPTFKRFETQNNLGINLKDWYITLSHVRHSIVHSLFNLHFDKVNFSKYQRQLFDSYFSYELHGEVAKLNLSYEQANRLIVMIGEYGFLLFKSYSIEMNKDWRIFKDM